MRRRCEGLNAPSIHTVKHWISVVSVGCVKAWTLFRSMIQRIYVRACEEFTVWKVRKSVMLLYNFTYRAFLFLSLGCFCWLAEYGFTSPGLFFSTPWVVFSSPWVVGDKSATCGRGSGGQGRNSCSYAGSPLDYLSCWEFDFFYRI